MFIVLPRNEILHRVESSENSLHVILPKIELPRELSIRSHYKTILMKNFVMNSIDICVRKTDNINRNWFILESLLVINRSEY